MGPDLLVLGEIARNNGLGLSLLHRLTYAYYQMGPVAMNHSMMLYVNHRSHVDLLRLSSKLFYQDKLLTTASVKLPPNEKYPLKFICSDLEHRVGELEPTSDGEVQLILAEVNKLDDPSNSCIMATNLRQVGDTYNHDHW